jgi:hypothetical protein
MDDKGMSLLELTTVCGIIGILAATALPSFRAHGATARIAGATHVFASEFRKAHSMAVRRGVYTAIRFERNEDGADFSVYVDGNRNGVRSADIASGEDERIAGPFPLHGGEHGVRVAILPGLPALPPARGELEGDDPIRFGRSEILSFSPLGTSTPGTFYIAGDGVQGAVRVTTNARVRLLISHGGAWRER